MPGQVAVEPTLSHIRSTLAAQGYEVTTLDPGSVPGNAIAYVVSGSDRNLLGIQRTEGRRAPVIDASGMTPEEVIREIERRVGPV